MSSIAKGIAANGAINILQKLVRVLEQLLLIPFFLVQWGAEYYGEWLTLSIIPSILAFSDLGFGSAVSNSFVLAYSSGDKKHSADLSRSGIAVISFSVAIGVVLTIGTLLVGNSFGLFKHSVIDAQSAMIAVTLLMASKLIGFYGQLIEGYFRAAHKAPLSGIYMVGNGLLNIIVGISVLFAGFGITGYSLSQLIVAVLFNVVYCYSGQRLIDFEGNKGVIRRSDISDIAKKGMGYLATPIWQAIYFQGSTFVVRIALGAEAVAVFNTVRTVCRSVNQLFSVINAGIFPDMQYEYGRGNLKTVQKLYRISILASFIIAFIGFVLLITAGQYIYGVWTNHKLDVPTDMWTIFMFGVLLNAAWWTSVVVYRVTNKPYHFAIMATAMSVVSVGASYLLASPLGLVGVAIGAVLFDLVMAIYVPYDGCRIFKMKLSDLWTHIPSDYAMLRARVLKKRT